MAAGMALSVVQTLLAALQCNELKELVSTNWQYDSRQRDLQQTVEMIKKVILDAECKHQQLNNEGLDWVEKLKEAIYDADDLFDELITKATLNKSNGKLSNKVRRFFSNDNQFLFRFSKSREIKKLRERLDGIAEDRKKFGINCDEYKPVKRREETGSYVYETDVIGRDVEKEEIVKMLLSDSLPPCAFISIVGMGGLGKTTFAQVVFNDKRIKDTFGEYMHWVCVSEEFGMKSILTKLLGKMTSECTLDVIQREAQSTIKDKRYLLVLDDVWEESPCEWLKLKEFLRSGGVGSRIIVTTRSREVARVADGNLMFELKGLSEEDSWHLFKRIAFGEGDDHNSRLVKIGKDIVKKCANVPLSIRVTSSLLRGQDESEWEAYRNMDLAHHDDEKDSIMPTLMFSYYNLTPELKSCFSFCSLFPKDYVLKRKELISLWMAQGYLATRHEDGSMEDVGEDYFRTLLQRCFFQDVKRGAFGEIRSCKMHDLMHDLALKVAGKETLLLTTSSTNDPRQKPRHVFATLNLLAMGSLSSNKNGPLQTLRTVFIKLEEYDDNSKFNEATIVSECRRLRVLRLRWFNDDQLCIGKFLHLRYLDVSHSFSLKMLPKSITTLHNLQMLNLRYCEDIIELPQDIGKLVNLRVLDIKGCLGLTKLPDEVGKLEKLRALNMDDLSTLKRLWKGNFYTSSSFDKRSGIKYMPSGMNKLRNLETLNYFVVGGDSGAQFSDLKELIHLRGHLYIKVGKFSTNNLPINTKGAYILQGAHLKGLEIVAECSCGLDYHNDLIRCKYACDQGEYHETSFEGLYPNKDLEMLIMRGYQGMKLPNWGEGNLTFPSSIVKMALTECAGLKHLSSLSKLVHLKYLELSRLESLEYIESDAPCDSVSETFFPSLEEFFLEDAVQLKGWWRDIRKEEKEGSGGECLVDADGGYVEFLPSFPCLRDLKIYNCLNLEYLPPCPHLKKLDLLGVSEALTFCMKRSTYFPRSQVEGVYPSASSLSSSSSSSYDTTLFNLEELTIIYMSKQVFNSLFRESFLGCVDINMKFFAVELRELREGFQRCASSLGHLTIVYCNFQSLSGGIEYLTNLQSLKIKGCHSLESLWEEDDDVNGTPWSSLKNYYLHQGVHAPY